MGQLYSIGISIYVSRNSRSSFPSLSEHSLKRSSVPSCCKTYRYHLSCSCIMPIMAINARTGESAAETQPYKAARTARTGFSHPSFPLLNTQQLLIESFSTAGAKPPAEARRATPLFDIRRACSRPSVGFPSRPWETRWTEIVFGIIGGQFLCTVAQYFGGSRDALSSCPGPDPAAPPTALETASAAAPIPSPTALATPCAAEPIPLAALAAMSPINPSGSKVSATARHLQPVPRP